MLLALVVVVIGALSALVFLTGERLIFGPTPTPTATPGPSVTATRDAMATRIQEDTLTQEAMPVTVDSIDIGRGTRVALATPTEAPTTDANAPVASPTNSVSNLPLVVRPGEGGALPEDTPTPTPSPTETETPSPTPTETPTPPVIETSEPTPPSLTTPTPMPTPTPTVYTRSNIPARVVPAGVEAYEGPSTRYEVNGRFPGDRDLSLQGRTESGEWVYACCIENAELRWLRSAQVTVQELTPTPESLPTEIAGTYNTIRWLPVRQADTALEPLPVATPVDARTFPIFRYARSGSGVIPAVPIPPLAQDWPPYNTGNPYSSPAIASGNTVVAANGDPRLYGVGRETGSQSFRADLTARMTIAAGLNEDDFFALDQNGQLYRFSGQTVVWARNHGVIPSETASLGINFGYDALYYTGTDNAQQRAVMMVRRNDGELIHRFTTQGSELSFPVIGDQLVYVGGSVVRALDLNNVSTVVWEYNQGLNEAVSAPPAYVMPGRRALAELYVGERDGEIHVINANTGKYLTNFFTGGEVTGIAVDDQRVYVTTTNRLLVYRVNDFSLNWSADLESRALGGPLVDGRRVFVALQTGILRVYRAENGEILGTQSTPPIAGAPAVIGQEIYVPGNDGFMYNWRGTGIE